MLIEIESILRPFAQQIETLVRSKLLASLGLGSELRKTKGKINAVLGAIKQRKKGPIQLCPVPGCKERAAPVFGMVCVKHKGLSKTLIAKYREARRAKTTKGKPKLKLVPKAKPKAPAKVLAKPALAKKAA